MKKISKLVLNQMAKKELTQRQQGFIKGGRHSCTCGCCYADAGISIDENFSANCDFGYSTMCSTVRAVGC